MLQANLAIVLTFITTLIDELGETENLTNSKLIVIVVAFITVIFLFNYTLKTENSNMDQMTKNLQNSMYMMNNMPKKIENGLNNIPGQLQNTINKGTNIINQGVKQGSQQLNNTLSQSTQQLNNTVSQSTQQLNNTVSQSTQQLNNTVSQVKMPKPTTILVNNTSNSNSNITTSNPPVKETFNNSTQRMAYLFKKL